MSRSSQIVLASFFFFLQLLLALTFPTIFVSATRFSVFRYVLIGLMARTGALIVERLFWLVS